MRDATHQEYDSTSSKQVIRELSCSLAGREEDVKLEPDTIAQNAYSVYSSVERFQCRYGLNEAVKNRLCDDNLRISGMDESGQSRIMELRKKTVLSRQPFFATVQISSRFTPPADSLVFNSGAGIRFRKGCIGGGIAHLILS